MERKKKGKAAHMISAVAETYDIHPQTLRLYEREGLLKPSRSEGNTRLYTEEDLERLELILNLTRDLGVNLAGFNPLAKGYGLLFQYLATLRTTVERVAAGQFTREAIAVVKNRQFIEFCERAGDRATATLYRDVIEPDERYHHELGRSLLLRFATTAETQEEARRAAARTLSLAEELQTAALKTAGIHHAPGC